MYSNSRHDVPRVAQRYGTIAAHIRRRASVLVVFVVFCVHMYSFAGLIRQTPPPTFSDTAITDRHSDTTIFQLRAHWVRISWSVGKIVWICAPGGSRTLDFLCARRAPYPLGQALSFTGQFSFSLLFIGHHQTANLECLRYPSSRVWNHTSLADKSYESCRLGHHLGSTFTGTDQNRTNYRSP